MPAILAAFALGTLSATARANTSSVFSPTVSDGERSLEYRASYVPSENGSGYVFGHRLHFQHALNERTRWRLIGFQGGPSDDIEFRYVRGELQHQIHEKSIHEKSHSGWDSAIRLELQVATQSGLPDRFRIGWTGKKNVSRWEFRANALADREFGSNPDSGIGLETRLQTTYAMGERTRLGIEMFSDFNTTSNMGRFDDQEHQLGPILKTALTRGLRAEVSYLFGISDPAPDGNLRLQVRQTL